MPFKVIGFRVQVGQRTSSTRYSRVSLWRLTPWPVRESNREEVSRCSDSLWWVGTLKGASLSADQLIILAPDLRGIKYPFFFAPVGKS
jgi:hypothetical protein